MGIGNRLAFGEFQHSDDGDPGFIHHFRGEDDFGLFIFHAEVDLLEGIEFHEGAVTASTGGVDRWDRNKGFSGAGFFHLVEDAALRGHDKLPGGAFLDVMEQ